MPPSTKALELVSDALLKLGVIAPGEAVPAIDANTGLRELQMLTDLFNAQGPYIFTRQFNLFTLIANHAPHTIGPGGDFNTGIQGRPVEIVSASFILNSGTTNPVDLPIVLRDHDWWAANPLKSLSTSVVTDLYYDPSIVLGNLNFYPVCNVAFPVRLEYWVPLAIPLTLNTSLAFAPGYWAVTVWKLAQALIPSYERVSPIVVGQIEARAKEALSAVFDNNDAPPRIDTAAGMPGSSSTGRPDFNFLTGLRE